MYPHGEEAAILDAYVTDPEPDEGYIPSYVDPATISADVYCPQTEVKWYSGLAQCWGTLPKTQAKKQYNTGLKEHLKVFLFPHTTQDLRKDPAGPIYNEGEFTGLTYKYFYCTSEGEWVVPDRDWYSSVYGGSQALCKTGPVTPAQ